MNLVFALNPAGAHVSFTTPNPATNITQLNVTGLTPSTSYKFVVIAADAVGNKTAYGTSNGTTPIASDTEAPVSGSIDVGDTTSQSTTLSWDAASDNKTAGASLVYEIYRSLEKSNLDTPLKAKTMADAVGETSSSRLNQMADGLTPNKQYWFTVIVRDEAGNTAQYPPVAVKTLADSFKNDANIESEDDATAESYEGVTPNKKAVGSSGKGGSSKSNPCK